MTLISFETAWGTAAIEVQNDRPARVILPPIQAGQAADIEAASAPGEVGEWIAFLQDYFRGRFRAPPKIDAFFPDGFALSVYRALQGIPAGSITTYKALATAIGRPRAYRAVAQALARNPFPIVIPCHRVIRSDGSLGGFSGPNGVEYKRRLLQHEGATKWLAERS